LSHLPRLASPAVWRMVRSRQGHDSSFAVPPWPLHALPPHQGGRGRTYRGKRARLLPMPRTPNPAIASLHPLPWHPGGRALRRQLPVAGIPHPAIVPRPIAGHPDVYRGGCDTHWLRTRGRRRLRHNGLGTRGWRGRKLSNPYKGKRCANLRRPLREHGLQGGLYISAPGLYTDFLVRYCCTLRRFWRLRHTRVLRMSIRQYLPGSKCRTAVMTGKGRRNIWQRTSWRC
jgi:hypothetical protein